MEGISIRCSFHALLTGLLGLRLVIEGTDVVAAGAMTCVAEVSRAHEGHEQSLVLFGQRKFGHFFGFKTPVCRQVAVVVKRNQRSLICSDCPRAVSHSAVVAIIVALHMWRLPALAECATSMYKERHRLQRVGSALRSNGRDAAVVVEMEMETETLRGCPDRLGRRGREEADLAR